MVRVFNNSPNRPCNWFINTAKSKFLWPAQKKNQTLNLFCFHGKLSFSFKKEAYSDFTLATGTHNFVHTLIKSVVRWLYVSLLEVFSLKSKTFSYQIFKPDSAWDANFPKTCPLTL